MPRRRTNRRLLLALALAAFSWRAPALLGQKTAHKASREAPISAAQVSAAKAQIEHGDLDAAEKTIWTVLSSKPDDQDSLTLLGIIRGRQTRHAEAEALFRRVLQLNPKSVVASRNLASALLAQDKPDDAIRQYNQAIQLSPQDPALKIEVAKLELERSNFAAALSALDSLKPAPLASAALPLKAAALLGLGRKTAAEALIPRSAASPPVVLDLAAVFLEADDPKAALRILNLLHPIPKPAAAQFHFLKGRAQRQQGDTEAALASFRQSLAADPKSTATLVAIAEVFATQNKHAESLAMLEKAHAASPDSRDVLRHLIAEAMQSGQNARALEAAQDLQRKSSELDDRYLVASVMLQQKQFMPASHILEDYVAQRPEEPRAYLGLGMAYLNLLRYPEAQQALEHSLRLNPNAAEANFQLGLLSAQQGDRQRAMQSWQKAVSLKPDHAQAHFLLGTIYLESGELANAESAFQRSLAADPNNMKTEYDLALVLNKLGKPEDAKQHFERYKSLQEAEHATAGNPPAATDHP